MRTYLMAVYPSGATIEHELDSWHWLMAATRGAVDPFAAADDTTLDPKFDEIWLCEDRDTDDAQCSVVADRILVWERS